ncbi:hypothetical protein ABZ192_11285 [Streptomyces sp. NPDC006235]|uniref:hypothetical protein n=1 Tax=Streptomyces sp. NPDC006235 TaxID=3156736 RepID=UPI0033AFA5F9
MIAAVTIVEIHVAYAVWRPPQPSWNQDTAPASTATAVPADRRCDMRRAAPVARPSRGKSSSQVPP